MIEEQRKNILFQDLQKAGITDKVKKTLEDSKSATEIEEAFKRMDLPEDFSQRMLEIFSIYVSSFSEGDSHFDKKDNSDKIDDLSSTDKTNPDDGSKMNQAGDSQKGLDKQHDNENVRTIIHLYKK